MLINAYAEWKYVAIIHYTVPNEKKNIFIIQQMYTLEHTSMNRKRSMICACVRACVRARIFFFVHILFESVLLFVYTIPIVLRCEYSQIFPWVTKRTKMEIVRSHRRVCISESNLLHSRFKPIFWNISNDWKFVVWWYDFCFISFYCGIQVISLTLIGWLTG